MIVMLKLLLAVSSAWAMRGGSVVENGGNFAFCPRLESNSGVYYNKIAILDILEGKEYWKRSYHKIASYRGQSMPKAFPEAVRTFFSRSPGTVSALLSRYARFSQMVTLVNDEDLPQLYTWSPIASSKGCEVGQAAIQWVTPHSRPNTPIPIHIGRRFWNALPTDQKIILLIHEYIQATYYYVAGDCAIANIRDKIGAMMSDQSFKMTHQEWSTFLSMSCR